MHRSVLVLVLVLLVPLVSCSFLDSAVDTKYKDPWDMELVEPKLVDYTLVDLLGTPTFRVEGTLEGYVVFGYMAKDGPLAVKVDGTGTVVWACQFSGVNNLPNDVRQLDNGNYLIQLQGNGIYEISPEGVLIWSHLDPASSHHAQRLPNGNTVIVECERSYVYEITPTKEVVWYWDAREEILPYSKDTYPYLEPPLSSSDPISNMYSEYRELMHGRKDWCHLNTAYRTEKDTTLLCLRNLDLIVEVDKDNNVLWTYGALTLKHPHCPTRLGNGNTLIFDNGNCRVIEVTPSQEVVWEFTGLRSPIQGGAQRLPSGDTLITDSCGGVFGKPDTVPRLLVVGQDSSIVWELSVPNGLGSWALDLRAIYRAWWYPS